MSSLQSIKWEGLLKSYKLGKSENSDNLDNGKPMQITFEGEHKNESITAAVENGMLNGKATIRDKNLNVIVSLTFVNNCITGPYKYYVNKRLCSEGNFCNSLRNGDITEYLNGNIIFKGYYVNDKRNGSAKEYDVKGFPVYEGEYKDGVRTTVNYFVTYKNCEFKCLLKAESKTILRGQIDANTRNFHGLCVEVSLTNKPLHLVKYENGIETRLLKLFSAESMIEYDENGFVQYEGHFDNDPVTWYSRDGSGDEFCKSVLDYSGYFQKNLRHGHGIAFYEDGSKFYHGSWKNGMVDGNGTCFNRIGDLVAKGVWSNNMINYKGIDINMDSLLKTDMALFHCCQKSASFRFTDQSMNNNQAEEISIPPLEYETIEVTVCSANDIEKDESCCHVALLEQYLQYLVSKRKEEIDRKYKKRLESLIEDNNEISESNSESSSDFDGDAEQFAINVTSMPVPTLLPHINRDSETTNKPFSSRIDVNATDNITNNSILTGEISHHQSTSNNLSIGTLDLETTQYLNSISLDDLDVAVNDTLITSTSAKQSMEMISASTSLENTVLKSQEQNSTPVVVHDDVVQIDSQAIPSIPPPIPQLPTEPIHSIPFVASNSLKDGINASTLININMSLTPLQSPSDTQNNVQSSVNSPLNRTIPKEYEINSDQVLPSAVTLHLSENNVPDKKTHTENNRVINRPPVTDVASTRCDWNEEKGVFYDGSIDRQGLQGKGRVLYEDKTVFREGFFINGEMNGEGKEYWEAALVAGAYEEMGEVPPSRSVVHYEGSFVNDLWEGKGVEYDYHGDLLYRGEFVAGAYCGQGEQINTDADFIAIGLFKDNEQNGEGKRVSFDQMLLEEGEYKDGQLNGNGTSYYINGNKYYTGDFENGLPCGCGTQYDNEGKVVYDGYVLNNVWNGHGVKYSYHDGVIYEGSFFNGSLNGKGCVRSMVTNLTIEEGQFENYMLTKGVIYYPNTSVRCKEGSFKNNLLNGLGRVFKENGTLWYKGVFENDIPNGFIHLYYSNGRESMIGGMLKGQKQGFCRIFDENGSLCRESDYEMDIECGEVVEYVNNCEISHYIVVNGIKEGKGTEKDDKGRIIFEGVYLHGNQFDGKYFYYEEKSETELICYVVVISQGVVQPSLQLFGTSQVAAKAVDASWRVIYVGSYVLNEFGYPWRDGQGTFYVADGRSMELTQWKDDIMQVDLSIKVNSPPVPPNSSVKKVSFYYGTVIFDNSVSELNAIVMYNGQGRYVYQDGSYFCGEWNNGDMIHSDVTIYWCDNSVKYQCQVNKSDVNDPSKAHEFLPYGETLYYPKNDSIIIKGVFSANCNCLACPIQVFAKGSNQQIFFGNVSYSMEQDGYNVKYGFVNCY